MKNVNVCCCCSEVRWGEVLSCVCVCLCAFFSLSRSFFCPVFLCRILFSKIKIQSKLNRFQMYQNAYKTKRNAFVCIKMNHKVFVSGTVCALVMCTSTPMWLPFSLIRFFLLCETLSWVVLCTVLCICAKQSKVCTMSVVRIVVDTSVSFFMTTESTTLFVIFFTHCNTASAN